MRRSDRAIADGEAGALLEKAEYGILSTTSPDGMPYGVPLNFCIIDECICFHSALEGRKIENILQQTHVSFCIVGRTEVLPEQFGTKYESVIVVGEVRELFELEKQAALEGLLSKYSSAFFDKGLKYIEGMKKKTRVFAIRIKQCTGKARKQ